MYKKGEFGKSTMRSLTYTAVPFTVVKIPVLLLLFCLLNSSLPPVLLLVPLFFFLFLDIYGQERYGTYKYSTVLWKRREEGKAAYRNDKDSPRNVSESEKVTVYDK